MNNSRGTTVVCALATGVLALFLCLTASSGPADAVQSHTAGAGYATAALRTPADGFIGNRACIRLAHDKHLPPLSHSQAAPNPALVAELSLLRDGSTPLDSTTLGTWDRYPNLITTVFTRYTRVFNGPHEVKVAFVPVTYCEQTISGPLTNTNNTTARESLRQAIMMLVLSNPGVHPPVIVGDAQQIKNGPGFAGLDLANHAGFVEAAVVPDGVSRVVMHFPAGTGPNSTEAVGIRNNVGIVVRGHPAGPTGAQWFDNNGKLLKAFTDPGEFG